MYRLLTVMPKQELLLLMRATYPPRFQPGQQSTGPLVSHRSRNWGALRRNVDSRVHMDRMAAWLKRSSLQEDHKKDSHNMGLRSKWK